MSGGIDFDIKKQIHPEPPTEEEIEYMKDMDSTRAGVFLHKMHMIASEGNETLVKLGASTGCRWGDTALAVYTKSGDNAVCATGLYHHAVLGQTGVKYIVKHWMDDPSVGVKPGDAFFCNDPFYLGVHAPDMGVIKPLFYKDKLVCWLGAILHTGECGASEPGGMPVGSRSIYDEGIQAPPIKIAENYLLKEDIVNMFNHMTRSPRTMTLDIKARMAALRVVEKRLLPVIEEVGPEYVIGVLRYVIKITANAARQRISEWNDGKFSHVHFLDAVGVLPRLMKLMVTLHKKGDHLYFDFDGTSPEITDRVINCHALGIVGVQMIYWLGHLFPDLPHNAGVLESMSLKIPEGSFTNPSRESPKSGAPNSMASTSLVLSQLVQYALFSSHPDRAECHGTRGFNDMVFGGKNQYGAPLADIGTEHNGAGFGARGNKDGVNAAGAYFAPMTSEPGEVESVELGHPFLHMYRGLYQDSCGHGKYRGGVGMDVGIVIHDTPVLNVGGFGMGSKVSYVPGLYGGYGIPALPLVKIFNSNAKEMLANGDEKLPTDSRMACEEKAIKGDYKVRVYPSMGEPLKEGDVAIGGAGGGGGYGDPIERDPSLVMQDLEDGIVSHWTAKNVYKVAYDQENLAVDKEKTESIREQERKDRKTKGVTFAEFEKEWLKKMPTDETLEYYGEWPIQKYDSFVQFGDWMEELK